MELGLVGLGKMGRNMAQRIRDAGHRVVGFDRDPEISDVGSLDELVASLAAPRAVWIMVPAGAPTRQTVQALAGLLSPGDIVIDGGNSNYRDDKINAALLSEHDIHYCDCGVSGGIWGLENGYGLMAGGSPEDIERLTPIWDALRPPGPREEGFVHAGHVGAGHFAKMVHNGIEYGLMHAYAEGWELLAARNDLVTDADGCFRAWTRGTVVRSWLLDLLVKALEETPDLADVSEFTTDSGEGRWTLIEAVEHAVPMPVLSAALFARFSSRQENSPTMQAVSALRGQFGGHEVTKRNTLDDVNAAARRKSSDGGQRSTARGKSGSDLAMAGPSSGTGATASTGGPTSGSQQVE